MKETFWRKTGRPSSRKDGCSQLSGIHMLNLGMDAIKKVREPRKKNQSRVQVRGYL